MYEPLKVVTWASVKGQCSIRYSVHSDDDMVFTFDNEFELVLDKRALHKLLEAGVEAATKMAAYPDEDDNPCRPVVARSSA